MAFMDVYFHLVYFHEEVLWDMGKILHRTH
jgi:hypothetical protein